MLNLYADSITVQALDRIEGHKAVVLVGSYIGYSNFGDIIQLKGAIEYHRQRTGLKPILLCDLQAVTDKDFPQMLRDSFQVEAIVFFDDRCFDVAEFGLSLCRQLPSIDRLHVYGGGFLNRYWGGFKLRLIEGLLHRFSVKAYCLSGQQIDPEFMNALRAFFDRYPPFMVGGRDRQSAELLEELGFEATFSFDDTAEIFAGWTARRPLLREPSPRLLMHMNMSSYTDTGRHAIVEALVPTKDRYPEHLPTVIQAYSDRRYVVRDSLASIVHLEHEFPFAHYQVIDLARMAMAHDPRATDVDVALDGFLGGIGIVSSYHTAMFLNLLGTPCYMLSLNEYYQQKRAGLGTAESLGAFLDDPVPVSFEAEIAARRSWLDRLTRAFVATSTHPVFAFPEQGEGGAAPVESPQPFAPKGDGFELAIQQAVQGQMAQRAVEITSLIERSQEQEKRLQSLRSTWNYLRFRYQVARGRHEHG